MSFEEIALALVVGYLIFMIYQSSMGRTKKTKRPQIPEKIKLMSPKTGQIIELQRIVRPRVSSKDAFDENEFILGAKMAFQAVSDAFVKGDKKHLKPFVTADVFSVFEEAIETRKKENQTVDFSLICFDNAEIVHKSPSEVTIEFVTEQINLLKDSAGKVLEGDPMSVAKVKDIWTFKKAPKGDAWLVAATQSGE